jgi:hypothetical protein
MAKEKFVEHNFNAASLTLIDTANGILNEYRRMGYKLSLRQLYYQLVARDYIENSVKSYKRIGGLVSDARLAGLLDWNMIEDRNRETVIPASWTSPAQIVRVAASQFRVDRWMGQPCHVEVMVEKDALSGILEPVCRDLHVRFTANKGYSSSSAMYETGKRIANAIILGGRNVHVFYLGDHDPSGIDMTRDIRERLAMFSDRTIEIHRLALNYDQVEQWSPPENPAKETDSRYQAYADQFGESSWELDAVEPRTLADLVREGIEDLIDKDQWDEVMQEEERMRNELESFADEYEAREDSDE